MLQIIIPEREQWNEKTEEFIYSKERILHLEHSLVSLSKWESTWHIPFLETKDKTYEQLIDYIRCMTITQNVDPSAYEQLTPKNLEEINRYIEDPMTAYRFRDDKKKTINGDQLTAELIYYWMISLNIPMECQKWHLNRLLALIRVCSIKNQPPKKRSAREIMEENSRINAERRKMLGSKG